jgi:Domain of unknown function (DUF222)
MQGVWAPTSYIECMFESDLVELDAARTLAAAEANEHALITAETRRLQIAAHWADLHPGEAVAQSRLPGVERRVRLGGEGTPTVGDFAAAELGCVLRMSDGAASRLIGDALDLRHRLPLIWAAAGAGQVPAFQARRLASATRHLTAEQASWVDGRIAPSLGAVSWGRLQTLLEAAIYQADPDGAEQEAAYSAQERFVRLGRNSEHGLKLIIARAAAGDAIWFKATVDRIADILAKQGDTDTVEVRRSKPSASSPNLPKRCSCSANTKLMTGTDPPNPAMIPSSNPKPPMLNPPVPNPPMLRLRIWPTSRPSNPPIQTRVRLRTGKGPIGRCVSFHRRSIRPGLGRGRWCMSI